jgi:hypothetical protein
MKDAIDVEDIYGTWTLVSELRTIVETGEVIDMGAGAPLSGFITYGRDGRMMALIVRGDRPCPESVPAMTDAQRAELFRTMLSYGGTFSFDGFRVSHHIDISWNQVWTGMTQVREVVRDGSRLVYRMPPAPFSADGRISKVEVVWEKVK